MGRERVRVIRVPARKKELYDLQVEQAKAQLALTRQRAAAEEEARVRRINAEQAEREERSQAALHMQRLRQKASLAEKVGNWGAGWGRGDAAAYDYYSYVTGHSKPWEKRLNVTYKYGSK